MICLMILIKRKSRKLHLPEKGNTYMVQITLTLGYNKTRRIKDNIIKKAEKRHKIIGKMLLQSLTAPARTPKPSIRSQSSASGVETSCDFL